MHKNFKIEKNKINVLQKSYLFFIKSFFDFLLAFFLLIFLSPVFCVISLLIKLDTRGPVFFLQERIGKNNRIFTLIKFCSMKVKYNNAIDPSTDVARITRTGRFLRKTSLDEIPQLLNIVKGDMSFIGPRPLLVGYLPFYTDEQKLRHNVKPGISGWSQINGRNSINWEEKFNLDIWYIKNISFILDIKIFIKSVLNMFNYKVVNNSGNITMPLYTGRNKTNTN